MTFSDIFENHPNYCRWVLITMDQGEEMQNHQLRRLANYIQQREARDSGGVLVGEEDL